MDKMHMEWAAKMGDTELKSLMSQLVILKLELYVDSSVAHENICLKRELNEMYKWCKQRKKKCSLKETAYSFVFLAYLMLNAYMKAPINSSNPSMFTNVDKNIFTSKNN